MKKEEKNKSGCLIIGLKVLGIGFAIILVLSILIAIFTDSGSKDDSGSIEFKYVHTAVNLRKGPGTDHDVIVTLSPGSKVEVIEKSGEWWKVRTSEVDSGYVYQSLLKSDPKKQVEVSSGKTKSKSNVESSDNNPTKETITQSTKETSEHSLGYKLAVIETGKYYSESDLKVKRYNSLINLLSGKYVENKQQIADKTVTAKQILTENGIDENMINIMEGMNKIYDLNNSYRKYGEYSSCYLIFRINGYNHDKSLSLLQESINTFGIKGVLKKLGIK